MTKHRPAIPKATREKVLNEFNHRCAVCGTDRPQIHHIDENSANNDELNLLPLCPNHHLTDQHNPTRRYAPEILRVFRFYKDPMILSPRFTPLYGRLMNLQHSRQGNLQGMATATRDLQEFILEFEMGGYYSRRIGFLLNCPSVPEEDIFEENSQEAHKRIVLQTKERRDWYIDHINGIMPQLEFLLVELLRYQNWPPPTEVSAKRDK